MKQMIVLASTIVLGVFIYTLIAGDGDSSLTSTIAGMWQQGLAERDLYGR